MISYPHCPLIKNHWMLYTRQNYLVQSNCKWDQNTTNLVRKAHSKIFFIRRLKNLGASADTLKDVYKLFVRSGLELSAPVGTMHIPRGTDNLSSHTMISFMKCHSHHWTSIEINFVLKWPKKWLKMKIFPTYFQRKMQWWPETRNHI